MTQAFYYEGMIIIDALDRAKKTIQAIDNDEFNAVKFKIVNQLNATINRVRHQQCELEPLFFDDFGNEIEFGSDKISTGPLKKLFGKEIEPVSSNQQNEIRIPDDPNEADVEKLTQQNTE